MSIWQSALKISIMGLSCFFRHATMYFLHCTQRCIIKKCKRCVENSACGCMFTKGCGWGGGRVCHSPLSGPAALRCPACAFQALKWALCARGEREKRLEQLWRGRRCFIHLSPWQRTGAREICPLLEPWERHRETLKSHQNTECCYFNHIII